MSDISHTRNFKDEDVKLIGMINYEMIGYFISEPNSQKYPLPFMDKIYPNSGDFIAASDHLNY